MYNVSQAFKDNIYANPRQTYARVTLDLTPSGVSGATVSTPSEFAVSNAYGQISNGVRTPTYRTVTWEPDRVTLGGQFNFVGDTWAERGEIGYCSDVMAQDDYTFEVVSSLVGSLPPIITRTPAPLTLRLTYALDQTTNGVSITFDPLGGEYATDFTIDAFDYFGKSVFTTTVTANTKVQYVLAKPIANFRSILITITKWSKPYRRARIVEIDGGVVFVWSGADLVRMSYHEDLDPIGATLAVPELTFTVDNTAQLFNPLNSAGLYSLVVQRSKVLCEIGLDLTSRIEWVPLGPFYLSDWRTDIGALTATFSARTIVDRLDSNFYFGVESVNPTSIHAVILNIFLLGGFFAGYDYELDPALLNIPTRGVVGYMTCREALQLALTAGCATCRVTRDGKLRIERSRATAISDTIGFSAMVEEPQIELENPVQSVRVGYYAAGGTYQTPAGYYKETNTSVAVGDNIEMPTNTLIISEAQARSVAQWMLARKSERRVWSVNWRGNPAIDLFDAVRLENRFLPSLFSYITKNEFYFEGYLTCRTEGRSTV